MLRRLCNIFLGVSKTLINYNNNKNQLDLRLRKIK